MVRKSHDSWFYKITLLFTFLVLLILPSETKAVIPPDFIFNIGTQIINFFAVIMVSLIAVFSTVWHFFKFQIVRLKNKKAILSLSFLGILGLALLGAYAYAQYLQKTEYEKWQVESTLYEATSTPEIIKDTPIIATSTAQVVVPLKISNTEFKQITESTDTSYLVLDAREDIEYDNGYFPGSTHIRFADLKAGRWQELSPNTRVFVLCWSGIRGQEVAEFLRSKSIPASYLEHGASGWVEFGGKWIGNITFVQKYGDKRYELVFSTPEVREKVATGVFLVDSREPVRFNKRHIPGSVNIPLMYTSTEDLEKAFSAVPEHSQVITVCDSYVNCFDAKLTGVELEKRGHVFLGRYNKPWEYVQ